jgi:(p)ppGpp synthase/HD superfamily hydrolase
MDGRAQTILQLFNQLQREGYANSELASIRNAYEMAIRLFTGYYIASGRTEIAHIVGTASILTSLRMPAGVVAAALIHNVYANGDFGDGRYGVAPARREQVRRAVGGDVEEYVGRFPALRWNSQTIPAVRDSVHTLGPIDRHVLLIRLADQLDHHRNLGGFYYHGGVERCREHIHRNIDLVVEIAEKLGFPALASELERVFKETLLAPIPVELPDQIARNRSRVIVPRSYRRRLPVVLRQKIIRRLRVWRSAFPGLRILCV